MICKHVCPDCRTEFYWDSEGDATLCVHCPTCMKHFQFYKNVDIHIPKGVLDACLKESEI